MNKTQKMIPIEKLHPFENHPYKVQDNEEMELLAESIRQNGLLAPVLVRPLDKTTAEYEIISGHRRIMASQKAGITEVPAFVVSLDRNAAAIALVDSNLNREHILPSEKAFAYKLKLEALKHQGVRTDITSTQVVSKCRTDEMIGSDSGESREQVRRYIRLTNLIPGILQKVDEGRIAFTPAVEFQSQSAGADQLQSIGFEGVLPQALHRGADDGGDASGTERVAAEAGTDAKSGCEVIRIFDGKKNDVVLWRHKCTGASRGIEFGFLEETIGKRKWGTAFGN